MALTFRIVCPLLFAALLAAVLPVAAARQAAAPARGGPILLAATVYKTPTCGCCTKWADYLRANGFRVSTLDLPDLTELKASYRIPPTVHSCHTALIDGYVVEGHVPVDAIRKLLQERPAVTGIAVGGMPMGSPGMEGAYVERYDVMTFDRDGRTQVYVRK